MKLYLISNRSNTPYDAAVVAAETMEEARLTHPEGYRWDATKNEWVLPHRAGVRCGNESWVPPSKVSVKEIGDAKETQRAGVILASYTPPY